MRRTLAKASFLTAGNVLIFTIVGTFLLAMTYMQTKERIEQSEQQEKLKLIQQLVPTNSFDNNIVADALHLAPDALLGTTMSSTAYRARLQNQPVSVVLEAIAPDGYSGRISLIIAIKNDGTLGGVRVVEHKETPGLGDYIDIAKSAWISGFDGKSLVPQHDADWQVKKDGGQFDFMAGATITPRAVVKATHHALQYFALHRDELFAPIQPSSSPEKGRSGGVQETKK
ncbi:MAG: electron transport complex subunit RsxG [Gallionella sp.]